ncbi:ArnT family glycosyltransferase [Rudanella lutea]|uniref:ArnT family glycosyltransferase n=1 Tax=Rudanella lutea TaxID=451374 RepID=UPI00036471D0|nr:glycosyltransferase family 39 protein [Rudanella lutea]
MPRINPRYYPILLVALGAFFFFPFLGRVHLFDWDEINFAESAREMLVSGNYARVQINFQPFWQKPPLFFWLQALAMHVFGVGEYAARFPNAVMGVLTLLVLYGVGRRLHDARFGFLWALGYLGSITPHFYFKTAIIDPTFNFFIFVGVWFLYRQATGSKAAGAGLQDRAGVRTGLTNAALAGLFLGLAVLTKGPVGALLPGLMLGVLWAVGGFRPVLSWKALGLMLAVGLLVTTAWFGLEVAQNGPWFLVEFIKYQIVLFTTPDAGHEQPFYYHFLVVLLGAFPMSVLAIRYLTRLRNTGADAPFMPWMVALFWVVMIVFSIVRTKIVHYSSMAWFPVSYLAAYHLYALATGRVRWPRGLSAGLLVLGILLGIILTAAPIVGMHKDVLIPYIKDPFAVANLQAQVSWGGWEWLIGGSWMVALVGCVLQLRRYTYPAAVGLFGSTALMLFFFASNVVPNVEQIVQGTVIDFYQSKQGQDVYVEPIGYKSYAQYFYFGKKPPVNPRTADEEYLLNGPVDKPTFLIAKITNADRYRQNPNLEVVKEENGFVFFKRK